MPEHADKENTIATTVSTDDGELTSPDFGFLANLISFHFRLLSIELNRSYDRSFVDTPLSGGTGKLSTLIVVANNPGVSQTNVAKALGKDRSAMVKLVDNLESKGLVTRRPAPENVGPMPYTRQTRAKRCWMRPVILRVSMTTISFRY
jgi:DNA-binding MarR family transcriptional regulator